MTTRESNDLIVKFLGIDQVYDPETKHPILHHSLYKYFYSWDWLMPVLQHIENLGFELLEDSNLIGDITEGLTSIDIRMTYSAVIKYIEFYNENN